MKDKNGKEINVGSQLHITGKVIADGGFIEVDRDMQGTVERVLEDCLVPVVICKRMGGGIIPVFPPSVCEVIA